jgi:hypothetical protein
MKITIWNLPDFPRHLPDPPTASKSIKINEKAMKIYENHGHP